MKKWTTLLVVVLVLVVFVSVYALIYLNESNLYFVDLLEKQKEYFKYLWELHPQNVVTMNG